MAIIPTADVELRKKPRRRVLYTGLIRFGDVSVSCVIRNLSEIGAALTQILRVLSPISLHWLWSVRRKSIPAP